MKKRNYLYKAIPKRDGHAKIFVVDIFQNVDLPLYMPEQWISSESIQNLHGRLSCILHQKKVANIELLIRRDKAMALCIKNGYISLVDNHYHHNRGTAYTMWYNRYHVPLVIYLETFSHKPFNANTIEANFIELCYIQHS